MPTTPSSFAELRTAIDGCVQAPPGTAIPASGPTFTIDTTALEGLAPGDLGWSFSYAGPDAQSTRQRRAYALSGSTLVIVGAARPGQGVQTELPPLLATAVQRVQDDGQPA